MFKNDLVVVVIGEREKVFLLLSLERILERILKNFNAVECWRIKC
jgi:hypothetical protein